MAGKNLKVCATGMGLLMLMAASSWMYMRMPQIVLMAEGYDYTSWLLSGYIIAEVSVVIVAGNLIDRIGSKNAVLIGVTLFSGGALGLVLADISEMMVAFRVIQGAGAGFMFTVSLTYIPKIYPKSQRPDPHKVMTAAFSIGSLAGTTLGYFFLMEVGDWRVYPLITAAIAILAGILAYRNLPDFPRGDVRDVRGLVLTILSIGSVMVFTQMINDQFDAVSWESLAFLEFCIILIILLVYVEKRVEHPIIPHGLNKNHFGLLAGMFLAGFCGLGMLQFITLFMMITYGIDLYQVLAMFLFLIAGGAVTSVVGISVLEKDGIRPLALTGPILIMIAFVGGYFLMNRGILGVGITLFLIGLGFGCIITEMLLSIQAVSSVKHVGSYTGMLMSARFIGIILGMAMYKAIISNAVSGYLDSLGVVTDDIESWIFSHLIGSVDELIGIFQSTVQDCCILAAVTVLSVLIVSYFLIGKDDVDAPEMNDGD